MPQTHSKPKDYIFLHFCILIYSITSVISKYASKQDFLSFKYIMLMFCMVAILGAFALLWQQAIKNFSPSAAYSNKSVTTIWTLIFSAAIFGEGITLQNIIGALLIISGVLLVTKNEK